MKVSLFNRCATLFVVAVTLMASGCGQQPSELRSGNATPVAETAEDDPSHGGWWCVEHGVPEEECSICSAKVAEEFKARGDWCEDHNRAESQCFLCDPSRAEKFAKLYEAKVGQTPPKPEIE